MFTYRFKKISNTESSLEQSKWNFVFLKKVNNSITTKLCANLLNNGFNWIIFSVRHNSITKVCHELFKYENKL